MAKAIADADGIGNGDVLIYRTGAARDVLRTELRQRGHYRSNQPIGRLEESRRE